MTKWMVSCAKFTGQVDCDEDGVITFTPPVWRRFMGQPIKSLLGWLRGFGNVRKELL